MLCITKSKKNQNNVYVNLFCAWCDFSLKQHSQKRGGIERSQRWCS